MKIYKFPHYNKYFAYFKKDNHVFITNAYATRAEAIAEALERIAQNIYMIVFLCVIFQVVI